MNLNLRYPNITGLSEKEQLSQIKSFLHQLVDQLNYAMPSAESSSTQTVQAQGTEISYYELRSLIMQNLDSIEAEFEKLSQKMTAEYVPKTGWGADKDIVTDAEGNVVEADHSGGATEAVLYTQQDLNEDQQAQARANIGITGTGEDGISPTVTVDSITGGHMITITDVNGTISFDVLDGKDGESGGDATVTAENIKAALGYTPADDADIDELDSKTNELTPIVSTTDITAGSAASSGRPYHVIE